MFKKLQQRWQVNGFQVLLVICTFALGGSLCGLAGRKVLQLTGIEKGAWWIILYIVMVTLLWPFCVLVISIPLGQFSFFVRYLTKIGKRMQPGKQKKVSLAIFASGAGSNAQKIIEYALDKEKNESRGFTVDLVVCNKPEAGVLKIAAANHIDSLLIDKERFFNGDGYVPALRERGIQFVVLAGFLWKIPVSLIRAFPNSIVNIHPALLPKYGGKGMYGSRVHEAVIAAGEKESGITIHYVDELYDHGAVIFQANCPINENDTAAMLAQKIHLLEHRHYPEVIDGILKMQNSR